MKDLSKDLFNPVSGEDFVQMFDANYGSQETLQGYATKGTVKDIRGDFAMVDVGLKSEGRVPLKEFGASVPVVGDIIDVFVERYESREGTAVLSYTKARAEKAWKDLEKTVAEGIDPEGTIIDVVRGGFTVDINGVFAFMPSSQVDHKPIRDAKSLIGLKDKFRVLKMDALRTNAIVSRRAIQSDTIAAAQKEAMKNISLGAVLEGTVKNITDYGVFVDLGGIDGLLHVTDLSWKRVNHPRELVHVGEKIQVKVIQFDPESHRISLGMKQLEEDPWETASRAFNVGDTVSGKVSSLTDYGAFIDLGNNIEGLVHMSELSWTNKNIHPSKVLQNGMDVNVVVLGIDQDKRRISLGYKQLQPNPWKQFAETHNVGDVITGPIKNTTEFGLFVALTPELDGMVHISDLSWNKLDEEELKKFVRGQEVTAKILDINPEKERVTLGIKQLTESAENNSASLKKGAVVCGTVSEITPDELVLTLAGDVRGIIRRTDLSREKSEQDTSKYSVGDSVEASVVSVEDNTVKLSVRALQVTLEKQAVKEFANEADSGSVLGDILGAAIENSKK
ncbi:MAG: 30S ribosomal protein S1 [Alphaproteobacteria bacterium]|nr:30S ribosomal protein S1 [Alphaproteobacteria bacterium]MBR1954015.1 30S ribosomal protein S1 [Alphaproteobacteria bacterium]